MKRLLCMCAALMLALGTLTAHAATDVTGSWTGDMKSPDGGDGFTLSFTFKQDGAKLTGTITGPQGDPFDIADGKVDGNTITFNVSFNGMTIHHTGTINAAGDEIKLTSKTDDGQFPGGEMTLKRVLAAAKP